VWPAFAKANGLAPDAVTFQLVDPTIRGALLIRGAVDAVAGFVTDVPIFANLGIAENQISLMNYADHGVSFYANAVFVRREYFEKNPALVAAFVGAVNRGLLATLAEPEAAIAAAKRDSPLMQEAVERKILAALQPLIVTPETRQNGLGAVDPVRLAAQVDAIAFAMNLPNKPAVDRLFTAAFLPPMADRLPPPAAPQ
jgi:NitT/TauT family transport system substrate-binding protein